MGQRSDCTFAVRGTWYVTVSKLLCASRSYSSAEICACSVTAGERLIWDSRWRWCAVKIATKRKNMAVINLAREVSVGGVVGW